MARVFGKDLPLYLQWDEQKNSLYSLIQQKIEQKTLAPEKRKLFPRTFLDRGIRDFFAGLLTPSTEKVGPLYLCPHKGGTTSQGLSLNRSQYGGCSTKYNTLAGLKSSTGGSGRTSHLSPEFTTEPKPEQ